MGDKRGFELALSDLGPQVEELQVVGVLGHLLHELGLCGGQGAGEVGGGGPQPLVELAHDLV